MTEAMDPLDPTAGRVPCPACRPDEPCEAHCGARLRQTAGGLCKLAKGYGTDHLGIGSCRKHGGNTQNHRAGANHQKAERTVAAFAARRDVDPVEAMLEVQGIWAGMVAYLSQTISEMESSAELKQLSVGSERYERPSVWVEMLNNALREYGRAAKACADLGIEERRTRLAESHGRVLDNVVRKLLEGVFSGLVAAGVRGDVLETFQREQLPRIVRSAVMAVVYTDPPDALPRGA